MKKNIRQKHIWLIALYGIFYLIGFRILEKNITKGYHEIHMPIDDAIPFCEFFIIPYFLWFFYIAVTVIYFTFFQEEVREYYQLIISLAIGMTLFLIISWLYPNGQNLRPVVFERKNLFVDLVRHLYRIDTPTNILPSIHVFNSVVCYLAIDRCKALKKHKAVRQGALVLTVLIVLSTMFLKQHSVFDVTCALVLNAVVYFALYQPKEQIQAERRVDGRKVRKKVFGH